MDKTTELDLNKLEAKARNGEYITRAEQLQLIGLARRSLPVDGDIETLLYDHERAVIGVHEHGNVGGFHTDLTAAQDAVRAALARAGTAAPAAPTAYTKQQVHEAWACVRKHNHSIPDDALDGMRDALYAILAAPAAPTDKIEEIRALLSEAHDFKSTSKAAQDNINAALDLLDGLAAPAAAAQPSEQVMFAAKRVDTGEYGSWLHSSRERAETHLSHNGPAAPKYKIVEMVERAAATPEQSNTTNAKEKS